MLLKTIFDYLLPSLSGRFTLYFGGGDSGGGEREPTAEEKRLWAAQGAALEGMTKLSLPMLETGMNNLGVMANESQDGTLASRLRGLAGADASAAMGQGLTGATQKLERYGSTMNPNALGAQMNNAALQGAAMKSSAMNQANMGAEDLKWSRNAALTGLASGQGNSAVSGMGSLAGQIGQNRQMNMQADNQAMQGLGMAGAWAGSKMFADGGEVKGSHFKNGEWYLNGGTPSLRSYMPQSGSFQPWEISGSDGYQGPSSLQQIGAVATPIAMMAGADAAKPYVTEAVKGLFSSAPATTASGASSIGGIGANVTSLGQGTPLVDSGASWEAMTNPTSSLQNVGSANTGTNFMLSDPSTTKLMTDAGIATSSVPTSTLASATAAPATAGSSSLMSGLGAAAPWLLGGLALANILDLKDGGSVAQGLKRKDMTKGGEVDGPGTSVSDSIPARLSDGEFVLNEGAVKMIGVDKLDALNQEGLKYRSEEPRMAPTASAEPHLSGGGFLHGLGMAAQGFVPTMMQLDKQKQDEAFRKEQLGLQKAADARAMAADLRTQQMFDRSITKEDAVKAAYASAYGQLNPLLEAKRSWKPGENDDEVLTKVMPFYNNQVPDGFSLTNDGSGIYNLVGKDGNVSGPGRSARMILDDAFVKNPAPTRNAIQGAIMNGAMQALQHDPAQAAMLNQMIQQQLNNDFKVEELGLKRSENDMKAPVYQGQAAYYQSRVNEPHHVPAGSMVLGADGKWTQVGTHPSAGGGASSHQNWQAFGSDADGTPVLLNTKNFDPAKPGTGLARIDGKPVSDLAHVYKSRTGDKFPTQATGLQPVQGNPGMYTDGTGGMFFHDGTKFVRQITPGSIDDVKKHLPQRSGSGSGTTTAVAPPAPPAGLGANNPRPNVYGSTEAMQRRKAELEAIYGDQGQPRSTRMAAEAELKRMGVI